MLPAPEPATLNMVSPVLVSTRTARLSSVTSAIEPSSVKSTPSIRRLSTDSLRMDGVDLTDDGSIALVTEDNLAVLVDTSTGDTIFSVAGSGAGNIFYRVSGDGHVFVTGGFNFDVYKFDGTTYQRVIHFSQAYSWFG